MAYLTWLAFSDLWMKPISLSRWDMALKESGLVWGNWRTTYGWGIKFDANLFLNLLWFKIFDSSPRMHLWKKQRSFMGTHWCWWRGGCLQRCVFSFWMISYVKGNKTFQTAFFHLISISGLPQTVCEDVHRRDWRLQRSRAEPHSRVPEHWGAHHRFDF